VNAGSQGRQSAWETPCDFEEKKVFGTHTVELRDTHEIGMGGPRVGRLVSDSVKLDGWFGGPFAVSCGRLHIPFLKRSLFRGSSFDLCHVDLRSKEVVMEGLRFEVLGVVRAEEHALELTMDVDSRARFTHPWSPV
jgi:hypothetical protein